MLNYFFKDIQVFALDVFYLFKTKLDYIGKS